MSTLDDQFGAWLKVVLPDSGTTERDQRLGVVRKSAGTLRREDILDLVLAFYSAPTEGPTIERFRAAMRDVDTSFGPKDDAELAVLAAGVLFEILKKGNATAATAALAVVCADFGVLATNDHITDVVAKARQYLAEEGVRVREQFITLPALRDTLQTALADVNEDDPGTAENEISEDEDGETALRRIVDALADYGDLVGESFALIEARRAEQSDILYWLLSGRRHLSGVPLNGLRKEEAAIFVAIELATMTRQIPGPASASAILSTLLAQCKDGDTEHVTLEGCIKSIDPADGARYLAKRDVVHPVITPISFILVKAEENGWGDGWQNAVKTQTRMTPNANYPILRIAEQLYRESLLSRSMGA